MSKESGWRVGRKVARNIYCEGEMVAVAVGDKEQAELVAAAIVYAMNGGRW